MTNVNIVHWSLQLSVATIQYSRYPVIIYNKAIGIAVIETSFFRSEDHKAIVHIRPTTQKLPIQIFDGYWCKTSITASNTSYALQRLFIINVLWVLARADDIDDYDNAEYALAYIIIGIIIAVNLYIHYYINPSNVYVIVDMIFIYLFSKSVLAIVGA